MTIRDQFDAGGPHEPEAAREWGEAVSDAVDDAVLSDDPRVPPTPVGQDDGRILVVDDDALIYGDAPEGGGGDVPYWNTPVGRVALPNTTTAVSSLPGLTFHYRDTQTFSADSLHFFPFFAPRDLTLTQLFYRLVSGEDSQRFGLCDADEQWNPGDLIWQLEVSGTGGTQISDVNLTLDAGRYLFLLVCEASCTFGVLGSSTIAGGTNSEQTTNRLNKAYSYGPLVDPLPKWNRDANRNNHGLYYPIAAYWELV